MSTGSDKIALIDLDGTLADYDSALRREMEKIRAPSEPKFEGRFDLLSRGEEEPSYLYERRQMIQRQPGFWQNLPKLSLGFEVLELLRGRFDLHILTKGPKKVPNAWAEKTIWCAQHVPEALVTVSSEKSLVYGRILFDDYPPYFIPWLKARPRGFVICLAHPWNSSFAPNGTDFDPRIFRYDGSPNQRLELNHLIQRVHDRQPGQPYQP